MLHWCHSPDTLCVVPCVWSPCVWSPVCGPLYCPALSLVVLDVSVQQLVVSAGENKVLQLPVDECTLSAYTVPVDTSSM